MKLFCSWSGDYSRAVASAVGEWIPLVLQHTQVFFSDHVLDPGDRWLSVISDALDEYDFGLIFVSKNNLERPWLLFEAGALAKSVTQGRVVPILLNLEPSDLLANPLSQFQSVPLDRENIKSVLKLILRDSSDALISSEQLDEIFETWWPKLETQISKIKPEKVKASKAPSTDDRLGKLERTVFEVLREVRNQSVHQAFDFGVTPHSSAEELVRRSRMENELNRHRELLAKLQDSKRILSERKSSSNEDSHD